MDFVRVWRFCTVAFALMASGAIHAAQSMAFAPLSAEAQAAAMHRGMNILNDDHIWDGPSQARFQLRHFAVLHDAGFDIVRLNMHAIAHVDDSGTLDPVWLVTLDRLVDSALGNGLTVVLDDHDDLVCENDVPDCGRKLHAIWSQLGSRYRNRSNRLLFEFLNEPHGNLTAAPWNTMMRDLLAVVRATNPERNVVIGPAGWSSVEQLSTLDLPAEDRHIIVTVHYYAPVAFTHQGARWVEETKNLSGITWGTDAELAKLVKDFDAVKAWSDVHQRPIFLGEFGAYEKGDMDSRARYLSAVARVAEAHGFPWAYWQFDSDFIAYDVDKDEWIEPILKALVPSD